MDSIKKKEKIEKLSRMIGLHHGLPVDIVKRARVNKLQEELSITLERMESKGLDEKIRVMQEVSDVLNDK